ncbi:MAG: MBL fold metallo-hydrolase [Proteobacteria bacterium]|nr:MBL fold metallo-hydrolase [Pseudomonadota bacterium]
MRGAILPVTAFQQNCTLLWDETTKRGVVVDPGGEVDRILAAIDQAGITVERILLTHGHIDHAGGADALRAALTARARQADPAAPGVPVEGPAIQDKFLLDGLTAQGVKYGIGEARAVTPDRWLTEGDTVMVGPHIFQVLHCPGHSPGHVAFFNHAARFAHVGDVLFRGSVGRTDFDYCDHAALISAITTKLLPLGDDISFVCGHGPGSTFGDERRSNPFLR